MNIVFFTGAGVSKESGIPTYRGKEGSDYSDESTFEYRKAYYFYKHPEEYWDKMSDYIFSIGNYEPNTAHEIIASYKDAVVITQNVDNLHAKAGSQNIIELHGSYRKSICLKCLHKQDLSKYCEKCGGITKPAAVFFGENLPQDPLKAAVEAARKADIFIIIGTSGVVYPAANLPAHAKMNGAKIYEINPEESEYTDHVIDIRIKKGAVDGMQEIKEILRNKHGI